MENITPEEWLAVIAGAIAVVFFIYLKQPYDEEL